MSLVAWVLSGLLMTACRTAPPIELTDARVAYRHASAGAAAHLARAELREAREALDDAERGFAREKGSPRTITLAYVAERTARIADARAGTTIAVEAAVKSKLEFRNVKPGWASARNDRLRDEVAVAEQRQAERVRSAKAQRTAHEVALSNSFAWQDRSAAREQEAEAEVASLARLAAKDAERGMIITLSGELLFRSDEAGLLPTAAKRLNEVGSTLMAMDRYVIVEGYAGWQGSSSSNLTLSQRRAEAVRDYLVSRGVASAKISARGMGRDDPSADRECLEGPSDDSRVEIVVEKK
jgi:outer membrane protein OmpA-like peptidoglycan-associated protein